ncbi:hypothetical protein P7F88_20315 [Vibrio hannami]|uniref:hypothetical protein n=1 Tax=Vibrio hannami TaxID=2717094 RepID=UPI0024108DAA|nr:hypothetical protein [Vibrio hannami]MDG3088287.1 hypothetical protein [Vibrio hannami]
MSTPKLAVVIHAEEEFDWDSGFYRSNTNVTHCDELIGVIDKILSHDGKVTLAMDYPFTTSQGGKRVIKKYKHLAGNKIEFATHLHPWVNPPFEDDNDEVKNAYSYPCNLSEEMELRKLKLLTDAIAIETGSQPQTYLAGRYGIGKNTPQILENLRYTIDISISAYCDFSHQEGPDFSACSNRVYQSGALTYLPHTCSVLSSVPFIQNYLNRHPNSFNKINSNLITRLLAKLVRIRKYRLSPEGFNLAQMKQVMESQIKIGQNEFILSFHSPSIKAGKTPYAETKNEADALANRTVDFVHWFINDAGGEAFLPGSLNPSMNEEAE